ncbi:hypothetical protein PVK06_049444 [Gossypium arboreum]|uniref:Uncharacterized protein n=1 Tax=Gossypium arboreum TaxID=29729 RepID=A0ABR0MIR2_GOSAR|nr:hypothetical protein PVK06_049444 [Gossypium arboreum]
MDNVQPRKDGKKLTLLMQRIKAMSGERSDNIVVKETRLMVLRVAMDKQS